MEYLRDSLKPAEIVILSEELISARYRRKDRPQSKDPYGLSRSRACKGVFNDELGTPLPPDLWNHRLSERLRSNLWRSITCVGKSGGKSGKSGDGKSNHLRVKSSFARAI